MGFFSWNCKCCGKSIRSPYGYRQGEEWMGQAVIITPYKDVIKGEYDGYGRVLLKDGSEYEVDFSSPCMYHQRCWEQAGKPKEYSPSEHAQDQGFFVDDEDEEFEGSLEEEEQEALDSDLYERPTLEGSCISAEELDRRFDDGDDVSEYMDFNRTTRPGLSPRLYKQELDKKPPEGSSLVREGSFDTRVALPGIILGLLPYKCAVRYDYLVDTLKQFYYIDVVEAIDFLEEKTLVTVRVNQAPNGSIILG